MAEYIEKKATIADLNKTYDAMSAFHPQFYAGYQFAVNRLRAFPTADVAPVRHGHWIDCEDEYSSYVRCSECGDEYTSYEADCAHTDFCPGCGARMDLGCVDNA